MKTPRPQSCQPFPAVVFAAVLMLAALSHATVCPAAEIRVDAGRKIGTIRAIHGVNGGPICYGSVVDGKSGIPVEWREGLARPEMIEKAIQGIMGDQE